MPYDKKDRYKLAFQHQYAANRDLRNELDMQVADNEAAEEKIAALQAENARLTAELETSQEHMATTIENVDRQLLNAALDEVNRLRDALEKITKIEASSDKVICLANIAWARKTAQEAMKGGDE